MKKRKCIAFLCVALSLVMLLSVTGFAGSVSFTADGGASATGSTGYTNASTSVSSPMYVEAVVSFVFYNQYGYYDSVESQASNAGTAITAYVSEPSFTEYDNTYGTHRAGSAVAESRYR